MNWKEKFNAKLHENFWKKYSIPMKDRLILSTAIMLTFFMVAFLGYVAGYYKGADKLPWVKIESVLPTAPATSSTVAQVQSFIASSKPPVIQYGTDLNCVEEALLVARNAEWQGLTAEVFKISFANNSVEHMVLGFPASDGTWVFVDPSQQDQIINPSPGNMLMGMPIQTVWELASSWNQFLPQIGGN